MDVELFLELQGTIENKKSFYNKKSKVYSGEHEAASLGIALPKHLEDKLVSKLPWGKIAVDNLLQDVRFEGFKNDTLGFTKLLKLYGGGLAIRSAQRNAMIGAVSFVTVLPDAKGNPIFTVYTGAEATGKWDSREGFVAGLVENTVNYDGILGPIVEDYLFFEKGFVHLVNSDGELVESVDVPTDRLLFVPFVYEQDVASKPFGQSRLNGPFVNALDSGLRNQKNLDIASEINLSRGKVLLTEGALDSGETVMIGDAKANLAEVMVIKSVAGTTMKMADLGTADIGELHDNLAVCATNAAAAVGMEPTVFGYQPSNGSFSEGTIKALSKPYTRVVEDAQESFGSSIKELALTAMSLATGQEYEGWEEIQTVFKKDVDLENLGVIGDGLGKILSLSGLSSQMSNFIDEEVLGMNVTADAMDVKLPNFEASRKVAKKLAFAGTEEIL